jgi:hypothetical protein
MSSVWERDLVHLTQDMVQWRTRVNTVVSSEVLTTVKMSMLVFWVVMPCGLVGRYQRFGETHCLHLQSGRRRRNAEWHHDSECSGSLKGGKCLVSVSRTLLQRITVFARVQAASRFLGQEFGNNNNSYVSRTIFGLCESKIFAIAFAALSLSLAAFTVICQWCHGLPTSGNQSIIDGVGY